MDPESFPVRWGGSRLSSSSIPRQGWPRLSPSYAGDADPSHHPSWLPFEHAVDQPDRWQHTTALQQSDLAARPSSRKDRAPNPSSGRVSAVPTQPVLVRAYSGNAENTTRKSSTMTPRRLFLFSGSKSSTPPRRPGPPLPSDQDFSIESILQAIEPDIRGTLDSIAEICGRSKLSLANEYGSHIAPLGEIRAPPGGLVPVEEASSTDERRADESVAVFEGDHSTMDVGHDFHPFSFYRYLENLRQAASALERNSTSETMVPAQPDVAVHASPGHSSAAALTTNPEILPATREFVSKPKHSGRDLLVKNTTGGHDYSKLPDIATSAVVSEVHLDAQANDPYPPAADFFEGSNKVASERWSVPEVLQSLLDWLKWTARVAGRESHPALQSAESRLRAMLERSADESTT
ncbi:uncharacterized protein N7459_008232 [Penicillium hispanicum]|uniref:uncharacterized protein n=1 Tax=Penicillium hispanicum TaxID=1080232 RepID=UPI0025405087|nr:uncharacterized protein N7459_008232 [Penicillium hispanicum]KAJ5573805.1 hypothetical protein N7459_008232 [Penicillium hispanicum]